MRVAMADLSSSLISSTPLTPLTGRSWHRAGTLANVVAATADKLGDKYEHLDIGGKPVAGG
jgi:hypothetical protein